MSASRSSEHPVEAVGDGTPAEPVLRSDQEQLPPVLSWLLARQVAASAAAHYPGLEPGAAVERELDRLRRAPRTGGRRPARSQPPAP